MRTEKECCSAEKVIARVVGEVLALAYFFCLLGMAGLTVVGVAVGLRAIADLFEWLWRVMP
jgi:hypothetical protein